MTNTSEGKSLENEPWYQDYLEFMEVLSELDEEKAPEVGLTFDLFL